MAPRHPADPHPPHHRVRIGDGDADLAAGPHVAPARPRRRRPRPLPDRGRVRRGRRRCCRHPPAADHADRRYRPAGGGLLGAYRAQPCRLIGPLPGVSTHRDPGVRGLLSGLNIAGHENVPKDGPAILAPVHRSYLDIPFTGMLAWRQVHFVAKAELWERSFSRWFCEQMGSFPVKRGQCDRGSLSGRSRSSRRAVSSRCSQRSTCTVRRGPRCRRSARRGLRRAEDRSAGGPDRDTRGVTAPWAWAARSPKPKKIRVLTRATAGSALPRRATVTRVASKKGSEQLHAELQRLYAGLPRDLVTAITVRGLTKDYGDVKAVDNLGVGGFAGSCLGSSGRTGQGKRHHPDAARPDPPDRRIGRGARRGRGPTRCHPC